MPCRDNGYNEELYQEHYENLQLRERNNKLAQMLCGLCRSLESGDMLRVYFTSIKGLEKWWQEHKKQDAIRIEREAFEQTQEKLKKSGLNKLTPDERKALGL